MADISMCSGIAVGGKPCPLRESCYRYTAPASPHWQVYLVPRVTDGKCEDYWPVMSARPNN